MNKLIFRGNVDETEVGLLKVGMPMSISIGAMPDMTPSAVIEYISPKGNDQSGANSFEIKAVLNIENSEGLRSGYSANATVSLAKAEAVLSLPEAVITFEGDSTFVFVQTDSLPKPVYERRAVNTGMSDGIKIEIKSGVDSTDIVRAAPLNM